ncbi:acyl-CoA dehydrogenase family protein [Microbacterium sp. X-17]|uniref:acyl-CoA dehydrogenase family protein n=1 Tax=Microbacterium sp. X-17 TaxID=3144404 RepID=UPI0031F58C64
MSLTEPSRDELVARATALVPFLRGNAERVENERQIGEDTIAALRDAGLLRLAVPKRFGGYEADLGTQVAVLSEIGRGDGAPAWVAGLYTGAAALVGRFGEQAQQDVWGSNPDAIICGASGSVGVGTRVEGGYLLNGAWSNSSGSLYAQWGTIGMMTTDESGEVQGGIALVDRTKFTIKDTWYVSGLNGTGSVTMVGEDVFVPDHRVMFRSGPEDNFRRTPFDDEALYHVAFIPMGNAVVAGGVLGMAKAALEYVLQKAPTKGISDTTYRSHVDAPTAQIGIARAATLIRAAEAMVDAVVADVMRYAERGEDMPEVERAARRLDLTWAGKTLREAVDGLVSVSGAGSFALANPLQRILRNVSVATRHSYMNFEIAEEIYGKKLLGNDEVVAGVI